jgi:predicted enzyme related to lactoylglutathione lyase
LIFALPPAELGIHPKDPNDSRTTTHQFYLMCDDINATVDELRARGVEFARPVADQGFGLVTAIKLPGGGELGIYQPKHPLPSRS